MDPTPPSGPVTPINPGDGVKGRTKILIALVAILAVVLLALIWTDRQKNEQAAFKAERELKQQAANKNSLSAKEQTLENLPPVEKTADIDAAVNGIIADYAADAQISAEDDADVQYINDSASLINSQGIYNENQF